MTAALAVVILLAAVLAHSAAWPWTACGRCAGSSKGAGSTRRAWNYCRKCGGTGRRLRFLARLTRRDLARTWRAKRKG